MTYRQADKDDVVNGMKIPAGTLVFLIPAVVNYDERTWGPDAAEFNPDRWDNLSSEVNNYSFLTFLQGFPLTQTYGRSTKLYWSVFRRNRNESSPCNPRGKLLLRGNNTRKNHRTGNRHHNSP
jgi:Cytochrome P450